MSEVTSKKQIHGIEELQILIKQFSKNLQFYKNPKNAYDELSSRNEYIDPFLKLLGWGTEQTEEAQIQSDKLNTIDNKSDSEKEKEPQRYNLKNG